MTSPLAMPEALVRVALAGLLVGAAGGVAASAPPVQDALVAVVCSGQLAIGAVVISRVNVGRARAILMLVSTGVVAGAFWLAAMVPAGPAATQPSSWDPGFLLLVTALFYVLGVFPVLTLMSAIGSEGVRAVRTRLRNGRGRCVGCGYPVPPETGVCPECGETKLVFRGSRGT